MTFNLNYLRGCLIGTFLGLCLGMYLTSQMYVGKLPDNPNYVETFKNQERLR